MMKKKDSVTPTRTIAAVVTSAMKALGNASSISDIHEKVRDLASAREWQTWSEGSIRTAIRGALKSTGRDGALPEFYAVGGEYKALTLFTVEEYETKAVAMARLSVHNRGKVFALAAACQEAHGRTFDAEKVIKDAAA